METNELTHYMDYIADRIYDFLLPHGFTKYNHTYYRWTKDGLCQVFDLQRGIKSLEGEFTANLGIFIPEVYKATMGEDPPDNISIGYCTINARFSDFMDEDDKWWEITNDTEPIIQELVDLLQTYGLPLFIKFPDRESFIKHLISFDQKYEVSMHPRLDIAIILEHIGRHEEAIDMFNDHFADSAEYPEHKEYLKTLAGKFNWPIHGSENT